VGAATQAPEHGRRGARACKLDLETLRHTQRPRTSSGIVNHDTITRFALRDTGEPRPKKFQALLADPTSIPSKEYTDAMDVVMRRLTLALVDGSTPPALKAPDGIDAANKEALTKSLYYFSQCIGVPHNLTFLIARQLRAHTSMPPRRTFSSSKMLVRYIVLPEVCLNTSP